MSSRDCQCPTEIFECPGHPEFLFFYWFSCARVSKRYPRFLFFSRLSCFSRISVHPRISQMSPFSWFPCGILSGCFFRGFFICPVLPRFHIFPETYTFWRSQKPVIPKSISINGNLGLVKALYSSGGLITYIYIYTYMCICLYIHTKLKLSTSLNPNAMLEKLKKHKHEQ